MSFCIFDPHKLSFLHSKHFSELESEETEEQIKGLCQVSLPASVVSSRRGSKDLDDPAYRKSGKPSVKLECENGTVFYADQVICTIPLGK